MRTNFLSSVLSLAALVLLGSATPRAQAGSFFGPCCYGSAYTARYPARSHNVFGNVEGAPCKSWHPFWNHWFAKYRYQLSSCNGCVGGVPTSPNLPISPVPAGTAQIVPTNH